MYEIGGITPSEIVEEASGISDARRFIDEFLRCGVDYGSSPDLAELSEMLSAIADEDPVLAAALTSILDER